MGLGFGSQLFPSPIPSRQDWGGDGTFLTGVP